MDILLCVLASIGFVAVVCGISALIVTVISTAIDFKHFKDLQERKNKQLEIDIYEIKTRF